MTSTRSIIAPALAALALACGACSTAGPETPAFVETEDISVCAPGARTFSHTLTNPYFPMSVGASSSWREPKAGPRSCCR